MYPVLPGIPTPIVWAPLPGSQTEYLRCPITEVLLEGNRGPGKTDCLLMDFAQFVGHGFGAAWRGILFRRTFPELADIVAKSLQWFSRLFPDATYNQSKHEWRFAGGETLRFSYMEKPKDYYRYHGQQFTWIGWDELTNWAAPDSRSTTRRSPRSSA